MKQKQPETTDWKGLFQPMIDVTEINSKTVQKFAELHLNYMTYVLDANVKQLNTLAESKDVKSAIERQLEFFKELNTKWFDIAEQDIATARDAQQSINNLLGQNVHNSDFLELVNNTHTKQ